jgi:hypothetical protein
MARRVVDYRSPTTRNVKLQGPQSRAIVLLLGASFVIPLGILLILLATDVRLGQGYFAYRYSPVRGIRTTRAIPAVVIGAAAAGAVMGLFRHERKYRVAAKATLVACLVAGGAWIWFAPPAYVNQQMFNMTSPSSDGAFVLEAREIKSLPVYLRDFPQRLKKSPAEMGGTRVLSNPPLTTVFAYAVRGDAYSDTPATDRPATDLERWLITAHEVPPENAREIAYALRVSILLCILWTLSGVAAYLLGRVFLSPAGAAVFAILVTFNPCTLHFVPGKDPAQLLSINLMLWAWFLAWRRRSPLLAALGGAILTVGATAGLVHIWVALIAFMATAWDAWRTRAGLTMVLVNAFAAGAGALAVVSAAYFVLDWNIPRTLVAVSGRWTEIQKTFDMNRAIWFAIGLPIFLLFLTPGFWTLAGLSLRRPPWRHMNFGTRLAICTMAVMLLIYIVMGVTYELPRLWVAFLPTLLLGLAIDRPMLRATPRGEHPRVAKALALIVIVHVVFTTMHWTLFDARESEYRLSTQRYYH